jgi:class 3 adenylate cyclase
MPHTAALLLTDIVDSAALAQRMGDVAMARLWAAHDRLARELLRVWRGREIDKTDGFLLLFADAGTRWATSWPTTTPWPGWTCR